MIHIVTGIALMVGIGIAPAHAGDWRDATRWEIRVTNQEGGWRHAPAYRTEGYTHPRGQHRHRHVNKRHHKRYCETDDRYRGDRRR